MVDFNQDETVAKARTDLLAIMILERRSYVLDAIEEYEKRKSKGQNTRPAILKSRLLSLFNEIYSMIKRDLKQEIIKEYHLIIQNGTPEQHIELFYLLSDWLDKKNITKLDTRELYDTTNTELENRKKGL